MKIEEDIRATFTMNDLLEWVDRQLQSAGLEREGPVVADGRTLDRDEHFEVRAKRLPIHTQRK